MKRLLSSLVLWAAACAHAQPDTAVPQRYFGLHMHSADAGIAWPRVPFGAWRLWDAHVTWKDLEPVEGRRDFARLDRYVAMAAITGTEVLLPLALSPRWASMRPDEGSAYGPGHAAPPRSLADWARFVETIAQRYRGRIAAYEVWNEPNANGFFSGSATEMVQLTCAAYEVIKRVDPTARVVSPSATHGARGAAWLDEFLTAGGGRCFDVVGFHFYTLAHEPPEAMIGLVERVRAVMATHGVAERPLWNTESGWYIRNATRPLSVRWRVLDTDTSVAYVARALLLGRHLGLERFFWYAWDDGNLGLLELEDGSLKAAAHAYAGTARWITGASGLGCLDTTPALTQCNFDRDGRRWRVLWSRVDAVNFSPPHAWRVVATEDLLGQRRPHVPGERLRIGPSPLLLESPP